MDGYPVEYVPLIARVLMSNGNYHGSLTFHFVDEGGQPLSQEAVFTDADDPYALQDTFVLKSATPSKPFRIMVKGFDAEGFDFQRVFSKLVVPQPIKVQLNEINIVPLELEQEVQVPFIIENHSDKIIAGSVEAYVSNPKSYSIKAMTSTISVGPRENTVVMISITMLRCPEQAYEETVDMTVLLDGETLYDTPVLNFMTTTLAVTRCGNLSRSEWMGVHDEDDEVE